MQACEFREIGLVVEALLQTLQPAPRLGFGNQLVGLDQDVPGVGLAHDHLAAGTAPLVEPEDMEPVRAAQDRGHIAGREGPQGIDEQGGQPLAVAPAEDAPLQRVGRVRKRRRHLPEIGAGADLLERLLGAGAPRLDLLRGGVLGDGHEDVREVEFLAALLAPLLRADEALDLALADYDLVVDFTLPQAREDDLAADILAEPGERDAVLFQRRAQLRQVELVLLGDALQRAVELCIVDAQTRFLGELQLHAVDDHPIEQLLFQDIARWRRRALLLELHACDPVALVQVAARDDLVVHHGHDAVDDDRPARLLRGSRGRQHRQRGGQRHRRSARSAISISNEDRVLHPPSPARAHRHGNSRRYCAGSPPSDWSRSATLRSIPAARNTTSALPAWWSRSDGRPGAAPSNRHCIPRRPGLRACDGRGTSSSSAPAWSIPFPAATARKYRSAAGRPASRDSSD